MVLYIFLITPKVLPNNIDFSKHNYSFHLMESRNRVNETMLRCMPYLISTYETGLLCQISIIIAHKQIHVICNSFFRNTIHHANFFKSQFIGAYHECFLYRFLHRQNKKWKIDHMIITNNHDWWTLSIRCTSNTHMN